MPNPSPAFDAISLIYKLSELVWYDMPENSIQRKRLEAMRDYIRETYDKSVYE